jgi:hypothetical protein
MISTIGVSSPKTVLYIDNHPVVDEQDWTKKEQVNVAQLILDNGNHWRKILTILAKLCCDEDWRNYRDERLLQSAEQICFTDEVNTTAQLHFFAGKSCWQRFLMTAERLAEISSSSCGRVYYYQASTGVWFFYTPYFDYRQFPNVLIDELKQLYANRL